MQKFADSPDRPKPARGAGKPKQKPYKYHGDERLTLARAVLREHPTASIPTLTKHITQQWTGPDYSASAWRNIIQTARQHPQDDTQETTP